MAAKEKLARVPMELDVLTSWEDFDLLENASGHATLLDIAPQSQAQSNAAIEYGHFQDVLQGSSSAGAMCTSSSLVGETLEEETAAQQGATKQDSSPLVTANVVMPAIALKEAFLSEEPQERTVPADRVQAALLESSFPSSDYSQKLSLDSPKTNQIPRSIETARGGLVELDFDSLCHCLQFLSLTDVCTVAQCCKRLKEAAYSDSVWQTLFRNQWPKIPPPSSPRSQRALFFDRWKACCQLRFSDPSVSRWACSARDDPIYQVEINSDQSVTVLTSQELCTWIVRPNGGGPRVRIVSRHRRHCSRFGEKAPFMVPIELPMLDFKGGAATPADTGPSQSAPPSALSPESSKSGRETISSDGPKASAPKEHFFLVSEDKVRLYSTVRGCIRTLLGGPGGHALCITDRVLALPPGSPEAVVATGGQDKVVRLWTLGARRKGEQRMVCSLRGHEDQVAFVAVARHNSSLLVSVSKEGTVKVWDVAAALALWGATQSASKSCLATLKLGRWAAGLAVRKSVCYVACGPVVTVIDLKRLQILGPVAVHSARITGMALNGVGDRLCTGTVIGSSFLWDATRYDLNEFPKPLAQLKSQASGIRQIQIDRFKVVTWLEFESRVNIHDAETGAFIGCYPPPEVDTFLDTLAPIAMRGPHLVLGDVIMTSADYSQSTKELESSTEDTELSEGDDLGRFWERPNLLTPAPTSDFED